MAETEHVMTDRRGSCACGWKVPLGEPSWRFFDRHLLDVRATQSEQTAPTLDNDIVRRYYQRGIQTNETGVTATAASAVEVFTDRLSSPAVREAVAHAIPCSCCSVGGDAECREWDGALENGKLHDARWADADAVIAAVAREVQG